MKATVKILTILLTIALTASIAMSDDNRPVFKKGDPILSRGLLDCTEAGTIICGEMVSGDTTEGSDVVDQYTPLGYNQELGPEQVWELVLPGDPETDWYQVTGTLSNTVGWMDLYLLSDCDENTSISFGFGAFTSDPVLAGTYYVVVDGYYDSDSGTYDLVVNCTVSAPPPAPPVNDTCDGAIPLCGDFDLEFSTTDALNDYTPGVGGCTGYNANGPDIVYSICLNEGGSITASIIDDNYDSSLYLITECSDPAGSCVAGGDDPEEITFTATETGIYFLIVDGYASTSEGTGRLVGTTGCCQVPTQETNWGSIKSLYR